MEWAALTVALCSAVGFAFSTSLQHHAAAAAPETANGAGKLLGHLLRRPVWVAAQAVGLVSFALHAVALRLGALAVVQPVVVSGIVFAVPVRAALNRTRPSASELGAVALTGLGLSVFLVVSKPTSRPTRVVEGAVPLVITGAGLVTAAVVYVLASRCRETSWRSGLFGVSAGVLFGLVAGLIKLNIGRAHTFGVSGLLTGWPLWWLVVAGLCGVAVNQRAYRTARLSASMPILNVVDVLVALVFGYMVFGEVPAHSPAAVGLQVLALACIAAGLFRSAAVTTDLAAEPATQAEASRSTH
jgi:hypothetical protein